jgi:hypothetical protein
MQVELRHVRPNPYRNLPKYPIDKAKIKRLKASIERSGFWDNIVARKAKDNGDVEIAYGHHRRHALLELYPPSHKIEVIERELGNGDMIKIMADENDEAYNMTPAIINETVKAARDFLYSPEGEKDYQELRSGGGPKDKHGHTREASAIAEFLDWDMHRVREALAEIYEIEEAKTEPEREEKKEILEKMPTQTAAEKFRHAAKKHKAPMHVQREVAERLQKGEIGTKEIAAHLIDATYKKKEAEKRKQFEQLIDETRDKVNAAAYALNRLSKFKQDLHGPIYGHTGHHRMLKAACSSVMDAVGEVFGVAKKQLPRLK